MKWWKERWGIDDWFAYRWQIEEVEAEEEGEKEEEGENEIIPHTLLFPWCWATRPFHPPSTPTHFSPSLQSHFLELIRSAEEMPARDSCRRFSAPAPLRVFWTAKTRQIEVKQRKMIKRKQIFKNINKKKRNRQKTRLKNKRMMDDGKDRQTHRDNRNKRRSPDQISQKEEEEEEEEEADEEGGGGGGERTTTTERKYEWICVDSDVCTQLTSDLCLQTREKLSEIQSRMVWLSPLIAFRFVSVWTNGNESAPIHRRSRGHSRWCLTRGGDLRPHPSHFPLVSTPGANGNRGTWTFATSCCLPLLMLGSRWYW